MSSNRWIKNVCGRVSFLTLLAGLFLGVAVAPMRLYAQADANSKIDSGRAALNSEEKKAESENVNVYRHSATVQWVSNLTHMDVETTAKVFEYINFTIILLAVGIPLVKVLPKVFKKRSAKLSFELDVARSETENAQERLSAVEAKLAGLDAEISAIRKQVEEEMREDEVRIKASITEDSARIVQAAEQEIVQAAAQAQRRLKTFVADLVIDRALSKLVLDSHTDSALIAEFASDVAGGKSQRTDRESGKAGQN